LKSAYALLESLDSANLHSCWTGSPSEVGRSRVCSGFVLGAPNLTFFLENRLNDLVKLIDVNRTDSIIQVLFLSLVSIESLLILAPWTGVVGVQRIRHRFEDLVIKVQGDVQIEQWAIHYNLVRSRVRLGYPAPVEFA
jgi:hypothetical protein